MIANFIFWDIYLDVYEMEENQIYITPLIVPSKAGKIGVMERRKFYVTIDDISNIYKASDLDWIWMINLVETQWMAWDDECLIDASKGIPLIAQSIINLTVTYDFFLFCCAFLSSKKKKIIFSIIFIVCKTDCLFIISTKTKKQYVFLYLNFKRYAIFLVKKVAQFSFLWSMNYFFFHFQLMLKFHALALTRRDKQKTCRFKCLQNLWNL